MIDAEIIKITLNAKYNKLLSDYDFEITKKNKTCGDLITIRLNNKKKTLTYDAKSCFFTKAAAEILSKNISKYNLAQLKDLKDEIRNSQLPPFPPKIRKSKIMLDEYVYTTSQ